MTISRNESVFHKYNLFLTEYSAGLSVQVTTKVVTRTGYINPVTTMLKFKLHA